MDQKLFVAESVVALLIHLLSAPVGSAGHGWPVRHSVAELSHGPAEGLAMATHSFATTTHLFATATHLFARATQAPYFHK